MEKLDLERSLNKVSQGSVGYENARRKLNFLKSVEETNEMPSRDELENLKIEVKEEFEDQQENEVKEIESLGDEEKDVGGLPSQLFQNKKFNFHKNTAIFLATYLKRFNKMMSDNFGDEKYRLEVMFGENERKLTKPKNMEEYIEALVSQPTFNIC